MEKNTKKYLPVLLLSLLLLSHNSSYASHLAGGEMNYRYIGDSLVSVTPHIAWPRYEVALVIYEDCYAGQPEAVTQDNPAFFAVYNASTNAFLRADSSFFSTSTTIAEEYSTPCGPVNAPNTCVIKKTFRINYTLPPNSNGYVVVYQRCCLTGQLVNILRPADNGVTYSCTLPAFPLTNNSALFKHDPPAVMALNELAYYDLSAADADGDSLSYELCSMIAGADASDIKPWPPGPPPFNDATYANGYSASQPIHASNQVQIDPVTGIISVLPNLVGKYEVAVCCHEWRGGEIVNTTRREFMVTVAAQNLASYHPDAGGDVTLVVGSSYQFHATNANTYTWTPSTYLDNPDIADPIGRFTDVGEFTYTLHGVSDSGCSGNDVIHVKVLSHAGYVVPDAFTPNGDGWNDRIFPEPIGNPTLKGFKIFNRKGNLVYESSTGAPGWDGTYHGKQQDLGTYFWEVLYIDDEGHSRVAKGDVILVR